MEPMCLYLLKQKKFNSNFQSIILTRMETIMQKQCLHTTHHRLAENEGQATLITKTKNATPLFFDQGDHVRFFLVNHGDFPINFHMVGESLDRVTDGSIVNGIGKQTYTIGGSNDAIVDIVFDKPGLCLCKP